MKTLLTHYQFADFLKHSKGATEYRLSEPVAHDITFRFSCIQRLKLPAGLASHIGHGHAMGGSKWITRFFPVAALPFRRAKGLVYLPHSAIGRRVAILYGRAVFACRNCHRLAYESQRETVDDRAARRADTMRRRLNWEPGILNGNAGKPKGMHHRTYDRLLSNHEEYVKFCFAAHRLRMVMKYGSAGISPEHLYQVLESNGYLRDQ